MVKKPGFDPWLVGVLGVPLGLELFHFECALPYANRAVKLAGLFSSALLLSKFAIRH